MGRTTRTPRVPPTTMTTEFLTPLTTRLPLSPHPASVHLRTSSWPNALSPSGPLGIANGPKLGPDPGEVRNEEAFAAARAAEVRFGSGSWGGRGEEEEEEGRGWKVVKQRWMGRREVATRMLRMNAIVVRACRRGRRELPPGQVGGHDRGELVARRGRARLRPASLRNVEMEPESTSKRVGRAKAKLAIGDMSVASLLPDRNRLLTAPTFEQHAQQRRDVAQAQQRSVPRRVLGPVLQGRR